MRQLILRIVDGAAGIGFSLFGTLILIAAFGLVIGGGWGGVVGVLLGIVGIASIGAALESWFGWQSRWHPVWIVLAFVFAFFMLAVIALQNIGP